MPFLGATCERRVLLILLSRALLFLRKSFCGEHLILDTIAVVECWVESTDSHLEDTHLEDTHLEDTHLEDTHLEDTHLEDTRQGKKIPLSKFFTSSFL